MFWAGNPDGVGMVTIAYNAASGASDWAQEYTGPQSGGGAYAIAVSPDGSTVFITGDVAVQTLDYEYATVAYQACTGTMRWAQVRNGADGSLVTTRRRGRLRSARTAPRCSSPAS